VELKEKSMSKFTVKVQPSGLLNGLPWPAVGETVDLPDGVAEAMVEAKHLTRVEKTAKKAAAKPDDAEKRPAAKADVETRKKN